MDSSGMTPEEIEEAELQKVSLQGHQAKENKGTVTRTPLLSDTPPDWMVFI